MLIWKLFFSECGSQRCAKANSMLITLYTMGKEHSGERASGMRRQRKEMNQNEVSIKTHKEVLGKKIF